MKVIAAIQAKSSSSRGLVHYIAHSKLDGAREPNGREIFNEYTSDLDVEKANDFLKTGISDKRPDNAELHHLVISLKAEDYERLGENEQERGLSFKNITRDAMQRFEKEIGADKLNWVAGIHRNTENPHVHIAVRKEYFDQNLEKRILSKFPASLLPHYEKSENAEMIFNEGLLIKSATEKLEEIIKEKEQLRNLSNQKSPSEKNQKQPSLRQENNHPKMTGSEPHLNSEREILARAILAKYFLDKSQGIVSSLENHGVNRRFKIFDGITKKHCRMSLFDLERRAEKNADQIVKKQHVSDPKAGEELKKKLISEELDKNELAIKRIKTILHNLLRKENQDLRERENEYNSVKPLAEKIKQRYRKANKKLPAPNLTGEELEMLQISALHNKDFRTAAYLERVRKELSLENKTPTRTKDEISRLKANQKLTSLNIKLQKKKLKDFQHNQRTIPMEINGKKRTLQEIDLLLQQHRTNERSFAGKVSKVLGKIGFSDSRASLKSLEETNAVMTEKLKEKHDLMETNLANEKSLLKMLDNFYQNETNPDKDKIETKYSADQLAEIESAAFTLKLTDVYRDNWKEQKQLIENTSGDNQFFDQNLNQTKENLVAGRALAREVLSEIEVARARDELANFKKYQDFQKFEIKDEQTGRIKFVSLAQVGLSQKGSILDQTLEYFLESRELRKTRHKVEKLVQEKAVELKETVQAAGNLLKVARESSAEFKTKSFFFTDHSHHLPLFTPPELMTIELRIMNTTNKNEAQDLRKILDSIEPFQSKNLSAILQTFDRNKESDINSVQYSPDEQKSASQSEKVEEKTQGTVNQSRENKTEILEPYRGR